MATISKKEIVKTVSERHGLTTTQTGQLVQVFMDQIIDELSRGNRIEFREFGIFELKRRKPRTARNPKTGDSVQVPEKTVVSFKPGKVMKAKVMDTVPAGITETDGDEDEDEDETDEVQAPSSTSAGFPQPPAAGR
ncbi:MAG: integration host factor subunit beta [Planctomycetes bacterium]|nr:integration host factor subunit beta [Planctomycetota bacterium]